MFFRLRRRAASRIHVMLARGVLDTPPLTPRPAGLIFCSMTSHRDLVPYLVAAKSLYRQVGEGRFVVVNDGSLSAEDVDVLRHHLVAVEIRHIRDITTGRAPRGGTWERLLTLLDLTADAYVVQVDSDTLTLGAVPELIRCYRDNLAFTLAGEGDARISTLRETAARARGSDSQHVQNTIERLMDRFADPDRRRYVRGCSGFAGFPRGLPGRKVAEEFSVEAEQLVGARWSEWGSEQVTSNYVVANCTDAIVLPYARYANYEGGSAANGAAFLHFIGPARYRRHFYARTSRRLIGGVLRA